MQFIEKIEYIFQTISLVNDEPKVNSGLLREQINKHFESIDISPPKELIDLYEWKNGILHLNAFMHFLPLEEAISAYRNFKEFKEDFSDFEWKETMFPILDDNGDVQYCIDLKNLSVICIDLECERFEIISDHYAKHLDAFVYIFENRLYKFNAAAGLVEVDEKTWDNVAEKFQINSV